MRNIFNQKYISLKCNSCINRFDYEKDKSNKHCKDCFKMIQKVEMKNYKRDERYKL